MSAYQRRFLACMAAMEAYLNVVSPSRAVEEAFDDEGLRATEDDISLGLSAVHYFKAHDMAMEDVAENLAHCGACPV